LLYKLKTTKPLLLQSLLLILALAAHSLICIIFPSPVLTTDSINYLNQADTLLRGGFGLYFPNGYPFLLAIVTLFTGIDARIISVIILNVLISVASVYLFYRVLIKYFGNITLALAAALVLTIYPNHLNYTRFILTEVPAVFFILLSFYFLSIKKYSFAGLMSGIAATIKTTVIPAMLFFSLYLIIKKDKSNVLQFLFLTLIPLAIMILYGYIVTSQITIGYSSIHNFYLAVGQPDLLSLNLTEAMNYYFSYALDNPIKFMMERFQSLWDFWGFLPSANEGLRSELFYQLLIGIRFPLLILAIIGFITSHKDNIIVFSGLILLTITLIHFIFYSIPRYNFAVEPFLIFLAAIGLQKIYHRLKTKSSAD